MKKNKWISYLIAIIVSICAICIVSVVAINSTDPNKRAAQYAKDYDGSQNAYLEIFTSNDCIFLQDKFNIAYSANEASQPGTIYSKRSIGFMKATDERMREIGCYDK